MDPTRSICARFDPQARGEEEGPEGKREARSSRVRRFRIYLSCLRIPRKDRIELKA